jgi:hypothetical protein
VRRSKDRAWFSDLARVATGCAAFALLISSTGVRAAEETASNIDIMQKLTAGVLQELHGKFSGSINGRAVRLKPAGTSEDYLFVTNVFREELIRLGVETLDPLVPLPAASYTPPAKGAVAGTQTGTGYSSPAQTGYSTASPDTSASPALKLQYQNVVFDLKYVDSHRSFVIGGKRVDRRAGVRVMATLSDESGRVLWVGEAARDHEDEIDYGEAARIEQGNYQFSHPVVPSGGWSQVVEPVFVTGVIVGLIYLFFSNQSDN